MCKLLAKTNDLALLLSIQDVVIHGQHYFVQQVMTADTVWQPVLVSEDHMVDTL